MTSLDNIPEGMVAKIIPEGSYAVFHAIGEYPKKLIETWENIWINAMSASIEVVSYNINWPAMFEQESILIQQALGTNCLVIHHIGSTSIPGLSAKPIIDILPVVRNILDVDKATKTMEGLGYEAKGEYGIAFRRYFQKGKNTRTHNVHVYEEGDPEIDRYLKFRDWMRSHEDDAQAYANLKIELSREISSRHSAVLQWKRCFCCKHRCKRWF